MAHDHLPTAFILACCILAGCEHAPSETPPPSLPTATQGDEEPTTSDTDLPLVTTGTELTAAVDHRVRVRGVAVRTKGWPSLMSDEYMVRLKDLPEWKPEEEGQEFTFAGRVSVRTTPPQPDDGTMRQDFAPGTEIYFLEECVRLQD